MNGLEILLMLKHAGILAQSALIQPPKRDNNIKYGIIIFAFAAFDGEGLTLPLPYLGASALLAAYARSTLMPHLHILIRRSSSR